MTLKSRLVGACAVLLLGGVATGASATNLVMNGDFSAPGAATAVLMQNSSNFVPNWTNTDDYAAYVPAGQTSDQTWAGGLIGSAGPGYGVANGLVGPPSGHAHIVLDGTPGFGHLGFYQAISGLVAGKTYTLDYFQAGGQEYTASGATDQNFHVTLGDQSWDSAVMHVAEQGFSPWNEVTQTFTWDGVGNTLTFFAIGPGGNPPFTFLADVSLTAAGGGGVPEPATWALFLAGFAGIGGAARFWRGKKTTAAAAA